MLIKALVENTSALAEIESIHGLSLYIESAGHKILFDAGPNDLFLKNALKLQVCVGDIDLLILSHGHYDHGDGIPAFLRENQKAEVHLQQGALDGYYAHDPDKIRYIGVSFGKSCGSPAESDEKCSKQQICKAAVQRRIAVHDGDYDLAPGIQIFSGVTGRKCYSRSNDVLFMEQEGVHVPDQFRHEQNMLITEKGKTALIAGCAHNGIVNIMERAEEILGQAPDYVISGFHLMNEDEEISKTAAREIAGYLKKYNSQYYTCHCTGMPAYKELSRLMGSQVQYLSAGMELEF